MPPTSSGPKIPTDFLSSETKTDALNYFVITLLNFN